MLTALVSTIALVLAIGPQLQINLQTVLDEPVVVETDVETPAPDGGDVDPVIAAPIEAMEETVIEPVDIATPHFETTPVEEQTETLTEPEPVPVQTGAVAEADWPAILSDASAALATAKTATGNFVQTNADGTITNGTFALNRPGRMRFDYDDPTPILIVSDGTTVAMQDTELETVDRVPIGATPLGLILSTQLSVEEDVDVLSILLNDDRTGIRVSDATGELEGSLTMVFDKTTYDLLGWLAVDGNFQTTVVDLTDVETNVRVDPRLFRLDEDDDDEDER